MQSFVLGTRLYFGNDALSALTTLHAARTLIVTDRFFVENGTAARVASLCGGDTAVFDAVQPDPDLSLIAQGVGKMRELRPELLVALGGGSAIDCAKGMLVLGKSDARLAAVPTTSGTGSEVTSFSVLTHEGVKHPLVDERLRPSIAILDDSLLTALPKGLIADAGMDVLAHCLEAVAAKNASPFTDAQASWAFRSALEKLPDSYRGDVTVRGELHCAATMAGIAFDNAGLGACHALSHALGGVFHLTHGRLNGILLPKVIEWNAAADPTPYSRLAAFCGLSGMRGLLFALSRLRRQLALPSTLTEAGLSRTEVLQQADAVCAAAEKDPCSASNPRPVGREDYRALLRAAL